jgi:hypothetical protein
MDLLEFDSMEELAGAGCGAHQGLFFHRGMLSDKVLVMFNGRLSNEQMERKAVFQRWSWSSKFHCSVIIVSDPFVGGDTGLSLGWYAGSRVGEKFEDIWQRVELLIKAAGLRDADVITFGSSAGGFASAMAAISGFSSKALVLNPQTDVRRYYKTLTAPYLDRHWPSIGASDERRLSLIEALKIKSLKAPIIYAQNIADEFHVKSHLLPFAKEVERQKLPVKIIEYDDPVRGHNPPDLVGLKNIFGSHLMDLMK